MSILQKLIGMGLRPRVRGIARGRSLADLVSRLEESRDMLTPRIERAGDTPGNRETLNHWLGIERWSQSRIKVAQGGQFQLDGYRGYRMPEESSFVELQQGFQAARAATLELAAECERSGFDPDLTITHNDLGELTVLEWFAYIDDHSRREVIRLRGQPARNRDQPKGEA